jgi:hypothetical protein
MGAGNQEIPGTGCAIAVIVFVVVVVCLSGCSIIVHQVGGIFQ